MGKMLVIVGSDCFSPIQEYLSSNQVVGSSNLSGRAILQTGEDHRIPLQTALVCGCLSAMAYSLLVSSGLDRGSVGHNPVTESPRNNRPGEVKTGRKLPLKTVDFGRTERPLSARKRTLD